MSDFNPGDKVTVTNPIQPSRFTGGETGEVVRVGFRYGMVPIRDDANGVLAAVYPQEITKS